MILLRNVTVITFILASVGYADVVAGKVPGDLSLSGEGAGDVSALQQQIQSIQETMTSQQTQLQSLQEAVSKLQLHQQQSDATISIHLEKQGEEAQQTRNELNALADDNGKLSRLFQQIVTVTGVDSGYEHQGAEAVSRDGAGKTSADDRTVTLMMENSGGVSYIRWGRTSCENQANVVYNGYAASSAYNAAGGTADMLCLHSQPQFSYTVKGGYAYSILTGVEYKFPKVPFSLQNNGDQSLTNNDMPCAVCHVSTRSHQLMIPGRNTCPSGWVREYWGFLVSSTTSHTGYYKGSMVCVDNAPESVPGGIASVTSHSIYPVTTQCVGLHCPPYVSGNEISCVVCSK